MQIGTLLVVAGEASGDLHGASLLRELDRLNRGPQTVFGLGGERLRAAGAETIADSSELSVVGLGEVLRVLPKARRIFKRLLAEVDRRRPAAAVLIDFPEFNLRLAEALKDRGVPVLYYVSPQIWAWRRGRLQSIAGAVDKMLVFFGFEVDFYRGKVDVVHVGHPLVDEVPQLENVWSETPPDISPSTFQIALLPGSRTSEIDRLLPVMVEAARRLASLLPCRFVVVRAPSIPENRLQESVDSVDLDITIESDDRFSALSRSHFALCASGTATLEVGLLGTPMLVVYKLGIVSQLLGRLLIRVPHISLVNLVLGEGLVDELVQSRATGEEIAKQAAALLADRAGIEAMRKRLGELRHRLGDGGASVRAAAEVAAFLEQRSS